MPFTFSHPALVLPLLNINRRRKIFSATGLVLGSMIPDFESFIRFDQHKAYSHTWLGVFWFDLPLCIAFAFIFHNIVRDPLVKNLPGVIGARFYDYLGFNWNAVFRKHFVVVIISMLIGIISHLLWDALTHLNLADPNATDSQIYIGHVRLYIVLQYASSLLGLIIVIWYILTHNKKYADMTGAGELSGELDQSRSRLRYWMLAGAIAFSTVIASSLLIDEPMNAILFIEVSISGVLLALILTPLIQRVLFSATGRL